MVQLDGRSPNGKWTVVLNPKIGQVEIHFSRMSTAGNHLLRDIGATIKTLGGTVLDNVHLHHHPQDPMDGDRIEPVTLYHKENPPTVLEMARCHHLGNPIMTPDRTVLDNVHLDHHPQH